MTAPPARTVRDAAFDVLRAHGLTTIFANPGSTEISLLVGLPDDIEFVLALHEGSVVGLATGWAIGSGRPALVNVHTTAGLGNAIGALATARVNRVPLVVLVGQQDRRHLAYAPFLAGELDGLGGDYPVSVRQPVRPQDVPGELARACHEAVTGRGPAIVVVPLDDWDHEVEAEVTGELATPDVVVRASAVSVDDVAPLVDVLATARSPAVIAGSRGHDQASWDALVALAEHLDCPVWQEPFGSMAGFPQDHPRFVGLAPMHRAALRATLAPHDVVLVVGAPAIRQYLYAPGPLVEPGTTVLVVTDDAAEVHRSAASIALLASPRHACERLVASLPARKIAGVPPRPVAGTDPIGLPVDGVLRPRDVFAALGTRLAVDTILVEESPSSRELITELIPARLPLGFVSAAMGGLGFALPAAAGLRKAHPDRPVVAIVGDGSAIYGIQALWSAAHYGYGVLYVIMANGRYAVMDRLAEMSARGKAPWPSFGEVSIAALARGFGCPAERIETYDDLVMTLDRVIPTLASRREPLVLDVAVG